MGDNEFAFVVLSTWVAVWTVLKKDSLRNHPGESHHLSRISRGVWLMSFRAVAPYVGLALPGIIYMPSDLGQIA